MDGKFKLRLIGTEKTEDIPCETQEEAKQKLYAIYDDFRSECAIDFIKDSYDPDAGRFELISDEVALYQSGRIVYHDSETGTHHTAKHMRDAVEDILSHALTTHYGEHDFSNVTEAIGGALDLCAQLEDELNLTEGQTGCALHRECAMIPENDREQEWVIGSCNSDCDGVMLERVYGTEDEVKEYLASIVRDGQNENPETFDYGDTSPADVKKNAWNGCLEAFETYCSWHVDHAAMPVSAMPPRVLKDIVTDRNEAEDEKK